MSQIDKEDKESIARSQLPYKAEYCKTNRAKCKKCKEPMIANSIKLASMVKSRFHDGYDANFYHVNCFFQVKRPTSVAEIGHFETLKYDDQKMIQDAIESEGLSVLGQLVKVDDKKSSKILESKKSDKSKSKKRDKDAISKELPTLLCNYNDFLVEYAKSGRSKCKKCQLQIEKNAIRLGKLDYEAENQYGSGPIPSWHHIDCFAKSLTQLKFFGSIDKVTGFVDLQAGDKDILKDKIKVVDLKDVEREIEAKKLKASQDGSTQQDKEKAAEEERKLKKQSDSFFALRSQVDKIKRKDLEAILQHMSQKCNFKNPSALVDAATDVLMFGPIKRCPQCKQKGGFVLRAGEYICTRGDDSDPCTYATREPKRGLPDIPDEIVEKYPFFEETYRFKGGKRLFGKEFIKAVEQKEAEVNKIVQEGAPLEGLNIGVIGWKGLDMDKTKIITKVTMLGGQMLTALDSTLFVVLATKDQLDRDEPRVVVAKELNVPFATPEFLFRIEKKQDLMINLKECLIGDWSGDLDDRWIDKRIKKQ